MKLLTIKSKNNNNKKNKITLKIGFKNEFFVIKLFYFQIMLLKDFNEGNFSLILIEIYFRISN